MTITSIKKKEIDSFCSLPGAEAINKNTIINLWENGVSKPGWCFVFETIPGQKGRVGFMKTGENGLNMFGLHLPGGGEVVPDQIIECLTNIFQLLQKEEIHPLHYHLESDAENHLKTLEILKKAGMQVTQTKKSYALQEKNFSKTSDNPLEYKTLSVVGKEAFLKAMQRVTVNTLDREDQRQYNSNSQKGAEEHFIFLQEISHRDDSWYLAYSDGHFVGLVIPQCFDEYTGAINYIGVDPKQRGKGYVVDLLHKGIENLLSRKVQVVIADIDDQNLPMEKALIKMGFEQVKRLWVLSLFNDCIIGGFLYGL